LPRASGPEQRVKPASFEYFRPSTVGETVAVLGDEPASTAVLAGGQSLVLEMNYRRRRPARLVDINGVAELDRLDRDGDRLRVGALTRHARFEAGVDGGPLGDLLSRVSRHIAHPPIRSRGTMVGSLAYAHPAAEWPALAVTLDGELVLVSASGSRALDAGCFFEGPFATACRPEAPVTAGRPP